MRFARFTLIALAVGALAVPQEPAHAVAVDMSFRHSDTTSLAPRDSQVRVVAVAADSTPLLTVSASRRAPAPKRKEPLTMTVAFAGAAATRSAKKRGKKTPPVDPNANPENEPQLTAKEARKVPLFVASEIHLPNDDKKGNHAPIVIKGGVLLDEIEQELTDDQLDELIALKAIRPATQDEIAAADARADAGDEEK